MKKSFKIGFWITEDDLPETGGGFSYTQRLIKEINLKRFDSRLEILFVGFNLKHNFAKNVINISPVKENFFKKKAFNFFHKFFSIQLGKRKSPNDFYIEFLKKNELQLLFYSSPYVQIKNFPYIVTNWDLGHKSTYSFPELSMNGQFEQRENHLSAMLSEALFICCESQEGKDEIIANYNIFTDQIKVLPLFPGLIIENVVEEIKPKWIKDTTSFFIYPAQFWPHKNHYNLILAFKDFIDGYGNYMLILNGSDKGNLPYIREVIKELGLESQIIIPGFISNAELKWLYKNSIGLVFPSFLGPTNMPLLEALGLGCNVACSNLKGHQKLLEDNAIYFDPRNSDEIKNALIELLNKKKPTINLLQSPSLERELNILESIFIEAMAVRKTWGQVDNII